MNGMNKTIVGVVFTIALIYSALCVGGTVIQMLQGGDFSLFLFVYKGDALFNSMWLDVSEYVPHIIVYYNMMVDWLIENAVSKAQVEFLNTYFRLIFVCIGILISFLGVAAKSNYKLSGTENPAQLLYTQRPKAFLKCLAAPWGFITGCWNKHKALVIIPVILLPVYALWSLIVSISLIVPYIIVKIFVKIRISTAAKKEAREYQANTQFGVCPMCKREFVRPLVKCRCGLVLQYPVPNNYGWKYHTCNKGHTIPCVSGKRNDLATVCPHCNELIVTREALPITLAFVGAVNSGKTSLMLSAVRTLSQRARSQDIGTDAVTPGIDRSLVAAKDVISSTPSGEIDSECLFIRGRTFQDREIVFNDISGREFEPKEDKILFEEYYNYTDGFLFVFDPLAITRATKIPKPSETFSSFHNMFCTIRGVSPSSTCDIPMAVVATRGDLAPHLKDEQVRDFLLNNGQREFVMTLESIFKNVRYFSATARGDDCASCLAPVWWIAGRMDEDLVRRIPI